MGNGSSSRSPRSKTGGPKIAPARRRSSSLKWSFRRNSLKRGSINKDGNNSGNSTSKGKSKVSAGHEHGDGMRVSSFTSSNGSPVGSPKSDHTHGMNSGGLIPDDSLVTIHDLFNLLNDGSFTAYILDPDNMLFIDARDEKLFLKLHVITAVHYSKLEADSLSLQQSSMVIIYGNSINNNGDATDLLKLKNKFSINVAGDILVLKEGFDEFYKIYPFMCTDRMINSVWERRGILTYPSVVLEGKLYQGKGEHAKNEQVIRDLKITHVLNITTEHKNVFEDRLVYLKLAIEDESSSNLFSHLKQTTAFIESALHKGGCVLVHCNLGVSRSSTATLAYLIKNRKWTLADAHSFLKSRRSCIRPNMGFLKQLSDWEANILGKKITDIDNL